ncbi:SER/THR-RICH PROTEIN T10 IN DGCR REGION [Salix koriyanagi]|uniref:SER/THR-RICH PROTEIN T10 IN DGCR REGION n=1 Tax=Salix koriyanagi TaxID=2511006 RepID=A0A9Q0SKA9_9ROSI|nr:SER/THR-RICH PROTEIN T10 IN DGCR REGION [Salix koriyanagi]
MVGLFEDRKSGSPYKCTRAPSIPRGKESWGTSCSFLGEHKESEGIRRGDWPKGEPVVIQEVSPGLHVLSNANLDSPWHKVQRLELNFKDLLDKYGENEIPVKEVLEKLMRDKVKADKSRLPGICSIDWEFNLSSIFVEIDTPLGCYGTRSTAALTIRADGEVSFYEIYLEKDVWKESIVNYRIQKLN